MPLEGVDVLETWLPSDHSVEFKPPFPGNKNTSLQEMIMFPANWTLTFYLHSANVVIVDGV